MKEVEINASDKRDAAFHDLNQRVDNFNDLLENVVSPLTDHRMKRVLNQLKAQEAEYKEAHHALMRVVMEQTRKDTMIIRLKALMIVTRCEGFS